MNRYSVKQYAESIGKTRQAVFAQIKDKRLPEGVCVERIGNTYIIITNFKLTEKNETNN